MLGKFLCTHARIGINGKLLVYSRSCELEQGHQEPAAEGVTPDPSAAAAGEAAQLVQQLAAAQEARRAAEEALRECRDRNEDLQLARDAMLQDFMVPPSPPPSPSIPWFRDRHTHTLSLMTATIRCCSCRPAMPVVNTPGFRAFRRPGLRSTFVCSC